MPFSNESPLGPKNTMIKAFRQLLSPAGRAEAGYFLAEGTNAIREVLATGWKTQAICFTAQWRENFADLLAVLRTNGSVFAQQPNHSCKLFEVSPQALALLCDANNPEGVVAVCKIAEWSVLPKDISSHGLLLDNLQDPGNLGTLIRSAAATGGQGLWLTPQSVDPFNAKVIRSATGQIFRTPTTRWQSRQKAITQVFEAKQNGLHVVAAASSNALKGVPCYSYWQADLTKPMLLILGNEAHGIADDMLSLADMIIEIPMLEGVESLNVGVAGSLIMYESLRQKMAKGNIK